MTWIRKEMSNSEMRTFEEVWELSQSSLNFVVSNFFRILFVAGLPILLASVAENLAVLQVSNLAGSMVASGNSSTSVQQFVNALSYASAALACAIISLGAAAIFRMVLFDCERVQLRISRRELKFGAVLTAAYLVTMFPLYAPDIAGLVFGESSDVSLVGRLVQTVMIAATLLVFARGIMVLPDIMARGKISWSRASNLIHGKGRTIGRSLVTIAFVGVNVAAFLIMLMASQLQRPADAGGWRAASDFYLANSIVLTGFKFLILTILISLLTSFIASAYLMLRKTKNDEEPISDRPNSS